MSRGLGDVYKRQAKWREPRRPHEATMQSPRIINLEEGWNNEIKTKAIDVLEEMLNNGFDKKATRMFEPKEYVQTYTTCYNMCTQRSPYNWSEQLYLRHGETICNYLTQTVLPALRTHHDTLHHRLACHT